MDLVVSSSALVHTAGNIWVTSIEKAAICDMPAAFSDGKGISASLDLSAPAGSLKCFVYESDEHKVASWDTVSCGRYK